MQFNKKYGRNVLALRGRGLLLVGSICLLVLIANDALLRTAVRLNPISRVNWLYQTPPTEFDIAILGSSLAKEGLDRVQLSQITDRDVVQLAWGGRGLAEQSLYWEIFLNRHDCQLLLLELHPLGLEQDAFQHPLDEFRYLQRLDEPIVERHLIRHCGRWRVWLWRWVPMLGMAEFNTLVGWHDVLALRHGGMFDPNTLGENSTLRTVAELSEQRANPKFQPGNRPIDDRSVTQFVEILELCRAQGIKVVAFYPPKFAGITAADEQSLARYREIFQHQLPGWDVPIYVVRNADYLQEPTCFQDAFHLNSNGCRIFTRELAEQVLSHGAP